MTEELVVAGTVFRMILLWDIASGQVIRRLTGHTGVIFDVIFCIGGGIASVSDDRTVRFWKNPFHELENEGIVMFGHTSRVWRVR